MSAAMVGRRSSRFTFNIPSPTHVEQPVQPKQLKQLNIAHHPPPPSSFLSRKRDTAAIPATISTKTVRRRKISTPHPITIPKKTAAFIDYSLSLQYSPSFSPSSCVISPLSPPSVTASPMSEMRQRRWSVEMLRRKCAEDSEQQEEAEVQDEHNMLSPEVQSSSTCSLFSPFTSSSLDTPTSSSPAPAQSSASLTASRMPPAPTLFPHHRVHSDPLPIPSTTSASAVAFKLSLRPLVIPASKDEAIIVLSAASPLPLSALTDRQSSYEDRASVDELLHGHPMSLSECWYGRSELMSPVSGASMMHMAAQNKAQHLPFSSFCQGATAARWC